jgi:predicted amino acid-binding ACT domain protein
MEKCPVDLAELSRRLEAVGAELGLKVMTQDAEVFRYMHRV